jgi:hypothetical protein
MRLCPRSLPEALNGELGQKDVWAKILTAGGYRGQSCWGHSTIPPSEVLG